MSEIWNRHRQSFLRHIAGDDLSNFLNWSTVVATMFVGDVPYVHREYKEIVGGWLKIDYSDTSNFETALAEPGVGNPKLLWGWTSGNLIHQLYHLKQWMDRSKRKLSDLQSIVEVGGGYGAMAMLCWRLGFQGTYHILDFPEVEAIQRYYLENVEVRNVQWSLPESCDLFIACHSLSEIPLSEREELLSQVAANEWLFAFSHEFDGVDNLAWFTKFSEGKPLKWHCYPHPYQENCLYQVGVEKDGN